MSFLQVVVKFIRKCKVLKECWITEITGEKIPMEVGLLRKLSHPNIVSVSIKILCNFALTNKFDKALYYIPSYRTYTSIVAINYSSSKFI